MSGRRKGRARRPSTADHSRLDYPTIRDRFLASHNSSKAQAVLLMEIGRYVQYCWLAEENERQTHPEKTEVELFEKWDECNEGQFDNICVEAQKILDDYARRKSASVIRAAIKKRIKPIKWLIDAINFTWRAALGGFIGSVGILLFGLLLLWLEPNTVKDIRGRLDKLLPAATQPDRLSDSLPSSARGKRTTTSNAE